MSENKKPAKIEIGIDRIAFFCECWHPDHNFFVLYDKVEDEVSVQVKLNHWLPWYKRAWVALKYILGVTTKSGDYDEVLLSVEDRKKLSDILLTGTKEEEKTPATTRPKKKSKE
jgi:hypothetical protein